MAYKDGQTFGRPRKEIDKRQFEALCKIQCTMKEISSVFGISEDTLIHWCKRTYSEPFSSVYKRYAEGGKASLRRIMWQHCEKSASMCMFMAKNLLGYKDNGQETDNTQEMCDKLADSILKLAQTQKGGGGNDTTDH